MKQAKESGANPLTTERWKRMEGIFNEAVHLEEPVRTRLVERLCGGDTDLLAEMRELLLSFEQQKQPVSSPAPSGPSLAGTRFGNFRLDRLLGQGGMSSVYLAHRDDGHFEQKVAVKLMSPHLASEFFTERFRRERQILANLNHPNVTRLIDGGVGASGDPYLIMEYVDGTRLDTYCDEHRLSVAQRIGLFLQICSAVEYSHAQQVIHCDLKPANIVVTAKAVPKLLDFGTAKLLSPEGADFTTTRFGMMTLRYASPEQLRGDPLTPATDTYSLGVVLYELVSGAWPFGNPQSVLAGLDRAVHEVKPAAASQVVTEAAAEARSATRQQLANQIGGDLERILNKAAQLRPQDRYSSVADFAADLQHFLERKPVAAGRVTFRKRQKTRVAVATAALLAVLAVSGYFFSKRAFTPAAASSIAVLPFVNVSGEARDQYIADGLTEDITDELTRDSLLRVIARASALRFPGKNPDIKAVSRGLHVDAVLFGSVDHKGSEVTVSARLQHAPDGALLWSRSYQRGAADLATLYSELASAVATNLQRGKSDSGPAKHVTQDEAYDLTLRAAYEIQQITPASWSRAEQYLRRSIQIDPQYARSYYLLSKLETNAGFIRGDSLRNEEERRKGVELCRKALALSPDYRAPRAQLASFAMQYDWDWALAERELRRTLASGPDVNAEAMYAFLLLYQRRYPEAKIHRRRAEELDPLSIESLSNSALFWYQAGDFERALDACRKLGKAPTAFVMTTFAEIAVGHPQVALRLLEKADPRLPWTPFGKAMTLGNLGQREEALRLIRPIEAKYPNIKVPNQWFAQVYAAIGDEPNTVKWLERSADAREWQVLNMAVHPVYKNMQDKPDFRALKRRIGLER